MIFILELSQILDDTNLIDVSDQLKHIQPLRKQFIYLSHFQNIHLLLQSKQSILLHKNDLENYLKSHADMMVALVKHAKRQANFKYKSVWKQGVISTQGLTNEQAMGMEILMTRYLLSSLFHLDCYNQINHIISKLPATYCKHPIPQDLKYYLLIRSSVVQAQMKIIDGYLPIYRLADVFRTLMSFMIKDQKKMAVDCKYTVFVAYKLLLESNLNFLYMQTLREKQNYEGYYKCARTTYCKIQQAFTRLQQIKNQISQNIMTYFPIALTYYKVAFIWGYIAFIQKNKWEINFTGKIHEIRISIQQFSNTFTQLKQNKIQSDQYDYCLSVMSNMTGLINQASKVYNIKQHHEHKYDFQEFFKKIPREFDYIDELF